MWSFLRLALGRNQDASGTADPQREVDRGNKMAVLLQNREGRGMRPTPGNIATYLKIFLPKTILNMREGHSRFPGSFPPVSAVITLRTVFIRHCSSFHLLENLKTSQTHTDVQLSTHADDLLPTWAQIQGRKKLLHGLEIRKD